ncbi:hypothetical protein Tco_0373331, partial [Tanacetum coccineum]
MKRVNTFTPMESDDTVPKVVAGSSKRDAEKELNQESSKRQKIEKGSESAKESKDDLSQEQLQQLMIIVPEEGMNVEALQTKYPIIDWEVYTKDSRMYWKIIRVGNYTEVYQIFEDMLKNFDRDDLVKLWSLVHERFNLTEPTEDKERELWVELKRLFEPDENDTLWKLQRYMHDSLTWRLYDTCGVHHVSTKRGHDIFMLVEKDYPLTRALMTLMLCNKLRVDQYSDMVDELLKKIFILANRPRQEVEQEYESTSAEEKQDKRNEMKARGTLLMALPNKDQLKFHSYKDAKLLMEAIEKRYGGNKESKKVQRTLLKQQLETFAGSSSEIIDQTFDRLQKLISQLEIQGEEQRGNRTTSLDDLYNNLKIYEPELTRSSSTSQNPQNLAFVSSNNTNSNNNISTNEADNTAYGVSTAHTQSSPTSGDNLSDAVICAFLASHPNSPQISREDLEQIDPDDLEEMDLQWEIAMLTIRARRFIKRTCRQLDVNGQRVGFHKSKVECYNCHNYQDEEEHPTTFALMAYTSSGSSSSLDFE